jgi:BrnA antitoxin of type II toxin-antitoxin system
MIELIYLNTRQRYQVKYIVRRTLRSSEGRRRPGPTPPAIWDAVPLVPFAPIAPSSIPIFTKDAIGQGPRFSNRFVPVEEIRRRPGRQSVPAPKLQITICLDAEVITRMHTLGAGWQVRANDAPKERLKTIKRSLHNRAKVRNPTLEDEVTTRGTEGRE